MNCNGESSVTILVNTFPFPQSLIVSPSVVHVVPCRMLLRSKELKHEKIDLCLKTVDTIECSIQTCLTEKPSPEFNLSTVKKSVHFAHLSCSEILHRIQVTENGR